MESLQLAQMLADLSSLNATEPNAAAALVTANKAIEKVEKQQSLQPPKRPDDLRRTHSSSHSRTASPAKVDKFGRRILMSPPMSRSNSAQGSIPGTPRRESDAEDDLDRASTLMALYDIRAKLKQQDNSSLIKAREKIAQLAARQQTQTASEKKATEHGHAKYTYPK